jgi:4'-phosphopantetheinyl transferase EntD
MPNYVHHTYEGGGIAIWHITETADELYALLGTHRYDTQLAEKKNESRRAEWLAVRLLVKELFGPEAEVAYHPTGRPYLKNSTTHISISHTKGFAAVAYHHRAPLGMDIEYLSSRVERIASRFTTRSEASYIDRHDESVRQMYHLVNWSAKETLYKLFDSPSMAEFKEALHIAPYTLSESGTLSTTICDTDSTSAEEVVEVGYQIYPDFVCTWAMSLER